MIWQRIPKSDEIDLINDNRLRLDNLTWEDQLTHRKEFPHKI